MSLFTFLLSSGRQCAIHTAGAVHNPYAAFRSLSQKGSWGELLFIGLYAFGYMLLASVIRIPEFRIHLLTKEVVLLAAGAGGGYGLAVILLYILGIAVKGEGTIKKIAVCWGYSLLATATWFITTSILFVLFPPPRTDSIRGITFSFLYLVFSSVLFFWKAELYYLSLRFAFRLDLPRIILVSIFFFPVMAVYAWVLYSLGIYKVPFL